MVFLDCHLIRYFILSQLLSDIFHNCLFVSSCLGSFLLSIIIWGSSKLGENYLYLGKAVLGLSEFERRAVIFGSEALGIVAAAAKADALRNLR